jgi:predicted Zn-dependent protease
MLEGDTALARKQFDAALAAYERAHKIEPAGALLLRQYRALAELGRVEEGEKRLAAWLVNRPQDSGIRMVLAERLLNRNQYKAAADYYLVLNQSNPGNLVVLNNLAWALFQLKDSRALGFAEQALKLKPDNPAVMDTLGWLLVQQGHSGRGIQLLQQALSKMPDAAEIQYHLAAAYAKAGDRAHARQELKRLLESGRDFPQENLARDLLKQLGR